MWRRFLIEAIALRCGLFRPWCRMLLTPMAVFDVPKAMLFVAVKLVVLDVPSAMLLSPLDTFD